MVDSNDSSPCFAHSLVDAHVVDAQTRHDVAVFRNSERKRLYELRKQQSLDSRKRMAEHIMGRLDRVLGNLSGKLVATYWPIRGELDLRQWMTSISEDGATVSLPIVVRKNQPVDFHKWTPSTKMVRGYWNIPVPVDANKITPEIVIVPLVGVDGEKFRLGNGGGYYDRTLARLPKETIIIGVGQSFAKMNTIFPMPWDIPMHQVLLAEASG